jgi:Bacterial Ig-like domain (group 3)
MTESNFESMLTSEIAAGDFTLTHTAPVPVSPTDVVTDSSGTGSAQAGQSVTFTATLAGPTGSAAPTGTVTWSVSGTAGATACTTSTSAVNAGTATCAITVSAPGTYVVSAAYAGDPNYTSATSSPDTVTVPPPPPTSTNPVAAIPVISMDSTTMTPAQVQAELAYLQAAGDHTIAAAAYVNWAEGHTVALPANPILLTVTGDNESFLAAVSPSLVNNGYSAVDFVSTAQADLGGSSATWAQLAALTPSAWQFSFSSGANGGTLVASDPSTCNVFYACEATGEGDSAYQNAVMNDVGAGRLEVDNQLWMQTVNDFMWSAPFGDAGQAGQPYNGPAGWLSLWASYVFPVVFVPGGASGNNQHNALDLTGSTTEANFESTLSSDEANGTFNG